MSPSSWGTWPAAGCAVVLALVDGKNLHLLMAHGGLLGPFPPLLVLMGANQRQRPKRAGMNGCRYIQHIPQQAVPAIKSRRTQNSEVPDPRKSSIHGPLRGAVPVSPLGPSQKHLTRNCSAFCGSMVGPANCG